MIFCSSLKHTDEPPSELSEILKVLETAAAVNAVRAETKRAAPVLLPPSPPKNENKTQRTGVPAVTSSTRRSVAADSSAPLDASASGKESYVTKMSGDSVAQSVVPKAEANLRAASESVSAPAERVAQKEIQYERSRRAPNAPGDQPARAASPVSDEGSASNSDSEDDWRSQRNKQKKTADLVSTTRSRPSNQAEGAAPPNAFWGAFGGAPTVRNTVRSTAQSSTIATEEVEDVRFNSAIAEYAQSVGLNLHRSDESDSDDESFEDEVPEKHEESVQKDFEEEETAYESPAEELPSDSFTDNSLPVDTGSLPVPPLKATEDAQESPVKSTPPPVPQEFQPLATAAAPVPVQAASGLLGAGGANRRAKGKVGSIMATARPRKEQPVEESIVPVVAAVSKTEPVESVQSDKSLSTASSVVHGSLAPSAATAPETRVVEEIEPVEEEVVVSPAELAALAVQRAVALDQVFAPVLSPVPYAYISNKASGSVAEFSVASLPAKLSNNGGSVERIVLVDIKLNALRAAAQSGAGDSVWVSVATWLMETASPNFAVLGMQCGTVTFVPPFPSPFSEPASVTAPIEEEICRLVLETSSDRVTDADLLYLAKSTSLSEVLVAANLTSSVAVVDSASSGPVIADFLHIRDSMTAPLMSDLEFFSLPLSNDLLAPHLQSNLAGGETDASILVRAKDIAVCAIKSHVLVGANLLRPDGGVVSSCKVLTALVSQAERAGLRLCGMRLVHLNALELFEFEHHCSVPAYTRPVPPADPAGNHAHNPHVLPVLCLAFHSSSHTAASEPASQVASAATKNTINTCPQSAANILRNLLGPEDSSLARKTDPLSLRAVYGTSKEHNLAYPLPHSADRLYKETAFWFGGRPIPTDVSRCVALLRVAAPRQVHIGVTLQTPRDALDASSASQLSALQAAAMRSVCDRFDVVGKMTAFTCFNSATSSRVSTKSSTVSHTDAKSVEEVTTEDSTASMSSLQLRWTFESHVGDAFLAHCAAVVQTKVTAAGAAFTSPWHVEVSWSSVATAVGASEGSHLSGSRLVALEMVKKVSEDDLKSHEDVGLPDVVVVTIGDAVSMPRSTSESPVTVLTSLLAMLPRTCEATLVAVKSVHHGAGLTCVLRGYQILENVDYAVTEVQRVASGGASPGKVVPAKVAPSSKAANDRSIQSNLCDTLKIHRGKRALEMIFTEFPLNSLYCDLAVRDLHTYVPLPSLQRTGLSWHAQATAVSAAAVYSSSQLTTESTTGDALLSTPAQYLQALYPPGVFTAVGVLVVPWLSDSAVMTRNIARIMARLEKDNFAVLEMKAVASLSAELIKQLYQENCAEYSSSAKVASGISTAEGGLNESALEELVHRLASRNAVVILVRRRSALLQLKSTIGPVYSTEVAEAQYPRSLVCLIHSLGGSAHATKSKVTGVEIPLILPTLSCASAQRALQEVFPHFYADHKVQMAALSLNALSEASLVGVSDSANIEHVEERVENTGEVNGLPVQVPRVPRINTISPVSATTGEASENELVLLPDTAVKHVDIAGVVVTHALLQEVGIGHLLEALHREGLVVRTPFCLIVFMKTKIYSANSNLCRSLDFLILICASHIAH